MTEPANAEPKGSEPSSSDPCDLKGPAAKCTSTCGTYRCRYDAGHGPMHKDGFYAWMDDEPPMTPGEEEQAPPDLEACDHQCECGHDHWDHSSSGYCKQCDCGSSTGHYVTDCPEAPESEGPSCSEVEGCDGNCCAKAPPQPDRRPPYAVAYSVQGHLMEVAVSGDAVVKAVDGALVITHALGPVAGIVQVRPYGEVADAAH